MTLNLHLPAQHAPFRPTITVIGVGGAGGNAVNNMINAKLEGVQFVVANTDAQALETALTERTIQLGANITQGLGAGASPDVGKAAAEEAMDEIVAHMEGAHMLFVAAGMGGGTGTGAAPVIAKAARDRGMLTVAIVTKPFQFEGAKRMRLAEEGLKELQNYVDTLIVIPNQNLFRIANEKTTFADAFRMADEVLHSGVRGVTDLMVKPGLVNLDFADIRTVMREMGKAMMGTGEATGDKRATMAAEAAISNPLLDDVSLKGARAALINITGGPDMTLFEVDEAANRIREEIDPDANIIFGSTYNEAMEGQIRVSVVATGIDAESVRMAPREESKVTLVKKPFSAPAQANAGSTFMPRKETMNHVPAQKPAATTATASSSISARPVSANTATAQSYIPAAPSRAEVQRQPQASMQSQAQVQQQALQRAPELDLGPEAYEEEEQHYYEESSSAETSAVSPRGQQPARDYAPQQEAVVEEQSEPLFWKPKSEDKPEGGGFSFLKKIAEVGHALAPKQEAYVQQEAAEVQQEEAPQPQRRPRVEISNAGKKPEILAAAAEKEDYYDIPAFLRRQAN